MKNGKKTISDIAKELNVSRSTISRVLNNQAGVGEELRQKVLEYIKVTDYHPNTLARSLIKGRINIIGLIFGDVRSPYYADLAFRIQQIMNEHQYMVMTFNSEYRVDKEIEFINLACQFNFAGLILITEPSPETESLINQADIPVVMVNRVFDGYQGDLVQLDNFHAAYLLTKYLLELRHPGVAFVMRHNSPSSILHRYEGYRQVLRNYQVAFDEDQHVFYGDMKMQSGYEIARDYLRRAHELPSAIIFANDMMAIGFMEYCHEVGFDIPQRMSVAGFDNIEFSSLRGIDLTTIKHQSRRMSEEACRLMLRRIGEPDATPERIMIEPELIVRGTTGPWCENRLDGWNP